MAEPVRRDAIYADLMAVPEHLVAEILFGALVTHPRPAPRHALAASRLGVEIGGPFDKGSGGPGGWIILDEPELHLGPHVVVPDMAGWRRQRLPRLPDTAWFETAPDWVCEFLSPKTERHDRGAKQTIYALWGVPHMWLINPVLRQLEAYELREAKWLRLDVFQDDALVAAPPFAEVPFELARLWPLDDQTSGQT